MLERDFRTLHLPSAFQASSHGWPAQSSCCEKFEARFRPLPSTRVENDGSLYLPASSQPCDPRNVISAVKVIKGLNLYCVLSNR